jgi:hypothetical protein
VDTKDTVEKKENLDHKDLKVIVDLKDQRDTLDLEE